MHDSKGMGPNRLGLARVGVFLTIESLAGHEKHFGRRVRTSGLQTSNGAENEVWGDERSIMVRHRLTYASHTPIAHLKR